MASSYHHTALREARDTIVSILFQGRHDGQGLDDVKLATYPVTDLPLFYVPMIAVDSTTDIYILGAQEGVSYELRGSNGQALDTAPTGEVLSLQEHPELLDTLRRINYHIDHGERNLIIPEDSDEAGKKEFIQQWKRVVKINSPNLKTDEIYRILAKTSQTQDYLNQSVFLRRGVNNQLNVVFEPNTDTIGTYPSSYIPAIRLDYAYAPPVKVKVIGAESGMNYQLYEKSSGQSIGAAAIGAGEDLILTTDKVFPEDTTIYVRTFRYTSGKNSTDPMKAANLRDMEILVRPNPALSLHLEKSTIPYQTATQVILDETQSSVMYTLFKRTLALEEYNSGESRDLNAYLSGGFKPLSTYQPGQLEKTFVESDLEQIGETQTGNGGMLTFETGILKEDTVFLVKAYKPGGHNQMSLFLDNKPICKVEPDIKVLPSLTKGGDGAYTLQLSNTQHGVAYQLELTEQTIPGFHYEEQGVGGIAHRQTYGLRVGVDFKVAASNAPVPRPIDQKTIFPLKGLPPSQEIKIRAIKSYTYVSALLDQTVTIPAENEE